MDHRVFGVGSKLHGLQSRRVSSRHDVRIERFAGSSLVEEERELGSVGIGGVGDGVGDRGIYDAAVKDAVATAENHFALVAHVPSKTDSWSEVGAVGWEGGSVRDCRIGNLRRRQNLGLIAQPEV